MAIDCVKEVDFLRTNRKNQEDQRARFSSIRRRRPLTTVTDSRCHAAAIINPAPDTKRVARDFRDHSRRCTRTRTHSRTSSRVRPSLYRRGDSLRLRPTCRRMQTGRVKPLFSLMTGNKGRDKQRLSSESEGTTSATGGVCEPRAWPLRGRRYPEAQRFDGSISIFPLFLIFWVCSLCLLGYPPVLAESIFPSGLSKHLSGSSWGREKNTVLSSVSFSRPAERAMQMRGDLHTRRASTEAGFGPLLLCTFPGNNQRDGNRQPRWPSSK